MGVPTKQPCFPCGLHSDWILPFSLLNSFLKARDRREVWRIRWDLANESLPFIVFQPHSQGKGQCVISSLDCTFCLGSEVLSWHQMAS